MGLSRIPFKSWTWVLHHYCFWMSDPGMNALHQMLSLPCGSAVEFANQRHLVDKMTST